VAVVLDDTSTVVIGGAEIDVVVVLTGVVVDVVGATVVVVDVVGATVVDVVVVEPRSSSASRLASAGSNVNAPEHADWRTDEAIVPFGKTHIPISSSMGAAVVVVVSGVVVATVVGVLVLAVLRVEGFDRGRVVPTGVVVAGSTKTATSSEACVASGSRSDPTSALSAGSWPCGSPCDRLAAAGSGVVPGTVVDAGSPTTAA